MRLSVPILALIVSSTAFAAGPPRVPAAALVAALDADSFAERERATELLRDRLDALRLLRRAGSAPSAEVRRRAARLLPALEAREVLELIRRGEVELFVHRLVTRPDLATPPAWEALEELARTIHRRATADRRSKLAFPPLAKRRTFVAPGDFDDADKDRDLESRNALAHSIRGRSMLLRSIVLVNGDVQCGAGTGDSVVFANGDVKVTEPGAFFSECIVVAAGDMAATSASYSILIARGEVRVRSKGGDLTTYQGQKKPLGIIRFLTPERFGAVVADAGRGVRVVELKPESDLARGGLIAGDVIHSVNGRIVSDRIALRQLLRAAPFDAGETRFVVSRGDDKVELCLTIRQPTD